MESEGFNCLSSNFEHEPRKRRFTEIKTNLSIEIQKFLEQDKKEIEESFKQSQNKIKVFKNMKQVESMWDIKKDTGFYHEYELGKKLGEGCQSSVYKCICKKENKIYAVKILRQQDIELFETIRESYRIMKKLKHENIIQAKTLFINEKHLTCHMVLEFSEWEDLETLLKKGYQFSKETVAKIIRELLKTVSYIHSVGVCHRDIKPDNILYNPKKEKLKLIDFELAKIKKYSNTKLEMMTRFGSPAYRAPEMFNSLYDEKVDIWSIGVIGYRILTGKMPFESDYEDDLIKKILYDEPCFEDLSVWEQDLFGKILCKNPKKRLNALELLSSPFLFINEKISQSINSSKCIGMIRSPSLRSEYEQGCSKMKDSANKFYDDDETDMFLGSNEGNIGVVRCDHDIHIIV